MSPSWRRPPPRPPGRPKRFDISPIPPQGTTPAPPTHPAEPADAWSAARFFTPAEALCFLAAVVDPARPEPPVCRRGNDGDLWICVRDARTEETELVWALGGVPYPLPGRRTPWAMLTALPRMSWIELAAMLPLGPTGPAQAEVVTVTTGPIARWVIRRYQDVTKTITCAPVELAPAMGDGDAERRHAVMLRAAARDRVLPESMLHGLHRLPDTIVCRPGDPRLLVDYRAALPLPDDDLARWVPQDEQWIMGGPHLGVWRVARRGKETPPPLRAARALIPPPEAPTGRYPTDLRITVRLREDDAGSGRADARLLDDADLVTLRRYLSGHPAARHAFLVLGAGRHLLTEPGGHLRDMPFGTPLYRYGPAGLYVQSGHRLSPALPSPACQKIFDLDAATIVVVCAESTVRLGLDAAVPLWTLWLGDPPAAAPGGLSERARRVLRRLEAVEPERATPDLKTVTGEGAAPSLEELRTQGFRLQQQGRFADAARRFLEAGDPVLAGRMYELAARELEDEE